MKTKNIAIVLTIGVLAALVVVGAGCWEKEKKEEKKTQEEEQEEEKAEEEELLVDVLAKAKEIDSIKYETVMTTPGQPEMTQKAWVKGKKARIEMSFSGEEVIYLMDFDKKIMYMYDPARNEALEMDLTAMGGDMGETPLDQSEAIMKYNPEVVGSEILDGKDCLVIKYTIGEGDGGGEVRSWIWKKYGLLIKMEASLPNGEVSVSEVKNIDFSNIPDSMFELPAGAEIIESPIY